MVGDELPEHLLLLAKQRRLVELLALAAPTRRSRSARRRRPPNSENCPAASALRSARIGAGPSRTRPARHLLQHARRACSPSESNAPAKIRLLEHPLRERRSAPPCGRSRRTTRTRPSRGAASRICCTTPSPDVAHRRQPVADRSTSRRAPARSPCRTRSRPGGRTSMPIAAARVQVVRLAVLVVLHAREDRRHVLDRMVRHQVRRLVRHVAVRARVRGVEPVVGERARSGRTAPRRAARRSPCSTAPADELLALRARAARASSSPMTLRSVSASPME